MKYKLTLFSLVFLILISSSLICAFESPEYKIGMDIPSGEQGYIEVIITNPDIEFSITDETESDANGDSGVFSDSPGGGGGGGCTENWRCGDWGECENGIQTRTCEDISKCGTKKSKPDLQRACDIEGEGGEETETITVEPPTFFSRITGAVVGGGTARIVVPLIFIILIVWAVITVYIKRKATEKITSSEDVDEVV